MCIRDRFCSGDTIEWFSNHGVELKMEDDGRMFPISDSSQTIIDCFVTATQRLKIDMLTGQSVQSVFNSETDEGNFWKLDTNHQSFKCKKLILSLIHI